MTKKRPNQKLALDEDTLRMIQDRELAAVQGGKPPITRQSACPTACTDC
jgi:hypothetical protein